jgi:hypothetical protein
MSDDVNCAVREGIMSQITGIRIHPGIIARESASNSIRPGTRSGCSDMSSRLD